MDNNTPLNDKLHWYKDAVIYELHIKAFYDGNGDGIGDFKGLMTKLDYLQDLGVTTIWVLPFFPSPLRDDGYDIADYYNINPSYGTISQFRQFLEEAHRRDLKVIIELVINHTSDQHPWFQRARLAPKGSPERNFYVWTDDPRQWKDVRIIFQDYESSNWTWDAVAGQYYWHRFFHHQPDLNYNNPQVQDEIFKVLDYWCEMGVDGFRLDAVPYLFERENTNGENLPETHAFLKKLRAHVDENFPGTVFLAEANMWPEDSASYFGNGDECHMNYHFPVMPRMFMSLQMEDRYPIIDIFEQTPVIPETCQWAMFLRNHDELTLEMVTDEERDYMYKVYAKDPKAKINLGIRHRLAPLMENNRRKIELMNCLLFSMPGTPVIYYGDEIGMGDNFYLGDRDGVRTPMQWSPDRNAGFSNANPQKLYLPVILDPEYNYEAVNVEMQRTNTSSLFWFMKRMINMRKRYKAFGRGTMKFINVPNAKILAFTRTYQDQTILVVVNLSKYSQATEIDLSDFVHYTPVEMFSKNRFPAIREDRPYFFTLGSFAYEWFVLEKLVRAEPGKKTLPAYSINSWNELMTGQMSKILQEEVIEEYMQNSEWFSGKGREISGITITNFATIPTNTCSPVFVLFEVNYKSNLPESYSLPMAFVSQEAGRRLSETCPQAIIAILKIGGEDGYLVDALYTAELQNQFLLMLKERTAINLKESSIVFYATDSVAGELEHIEGVKCKLRTEDGFTSISYTNGLYLKLYRKIDPTTNPDLEITRFLSEKVQFKHVPSYCGSIEWKFSQDTIALGMLQLIIEDHGDGYSFMSTRIHNYIERLLSADRQKFLSSQAAGTLIEPVGFDELPEYFQALLGRNASEQARVIGQRIGEMHIALASDTLSKDFAPEEFSLHYQRSLYSSMQSLVRETFEKSNVQLHALPPAIADELKQVMSKKDVILDKLKRIYATKLDVTKIRIHGNLNLGQVLFTGKDLVINDFGGDPMRGFSDRRLKRSPLRDVAFMVRSFRNIALEGFLKTHLFQQQDLPRMAPFARIWAHYMVGFFMKAYLETVAGTAFVPADKNDLKILLDTFLLEKSLMDISSNLYQEQEKLIVSLKVIKSIIN